MPRASWFRRYGLGAAIVTAVAAAVVVLIASLVSWRNSPEIRLSDTLTRAAPSVEGILVQRGLSISSPTEQEAIRLAGLDVNAAIVVNAFDEGDDAVALHIPGADAGVLASAYARALGAGWVTSGDVVGDRPVTRVEHPAHGAAWLFPSGDTLFIISADEWGEQVLTRLRQR
jgi:hypothetical protein